MRPAAQLIVSGLVLAVVFGTGAAFVARPEPRTLVPFLAMLVIGLAWSWYVVRRPTETEEE